jgi:uncharacterized protein
MAEGAALIYQGTLTHGEWTGRPDVLERREGKSVFGPWMYVPVDIKSNHVLEKYQKMQLMFYATLLEKIQGTLPAELAIINVDGERTIFLAEELIAEFRVCIEALERVRAGERPDPVLRKSCYDVGPWGAVCEHLARSTNDVALLFNVDVPKLRALRSLGLRTIDDVAEMDPQAFDGVAKGLRLHGLEVMKRQAQSLRSGKVMVREAITLPAYPLEIHFDIESDPPNDTDYLYGILIRHLDTELVVGDAKGMKDGIELDGRFVDRRFEHAGFRLHEQAHRHTGARLHIQVGFKLSIVFGAGIDAGFQS